MIALWTQVWISSGALGKVGKVSLLHLGNTDDKENGLSSSLVSLGEACLTLTSGLVGVGGGRERKNPENHRKLEPEPNLLGLRSGYLRHIWKKIIIPPYF